MLPALNFSFSPLVFLCLVQCFSNLNAHLSLLRSLLKCRLRFTRSGVGPEIIHF